MMFTPVAHSQQYRFLQIRCLFSLTPTFINLILQDAFSLPFPVFFLLFHYSCFLFHFPFLPFLLFSQSCSKYFPWARARHRSHKTGSLLSPSLPPFLLSSLPPSLPFFHVSDGSSSKSTHSGPLGGWGKGREEKRGAEAAGCASWPCHLK